MVGVIVMLIVVGFIVHVANKDSPKKVRPQAPVKPKMSLMAIKQYRTKTGCTFQEAKQALGY